MCIAVVIDTLRVCAADVTVRPEFRNEERGAFNFILSKSNRRHVSGKEEEVQELRVAQSSEPGVVAGSIAKKVRSGERVAIVSIGAGSVSQTVRAITIGKHKYAGCTHRRLRHISIAHSVWFCIAIPAVCVFAYVQRVAI